MSTGEGGDPRDGQARRNGEERRAERIGVGGGDDSVSRIQLAARWAEAYGSDNDSLRGVLHRFRAAYEYLDAVIHGVEPAELDSEADTAPDRQWGADRVFVRPAGGAVARVARAAASAAVAASAAAKLGRTPAARAGAATATLGAAQPA